MRWMGDSLGVVAIIAALAVGVVVALSANQLGTMQLAVGGVQLNSGRAAAAPAATPEPAAPEVDLTGADRAAGRIAFRSQCQECHVQGRQSFEPESRERLPLLVTRIREGTEEMPAFSSDVLRDDTLLHVLAYISYPSEPEKKPEPEPRYRGINAQILEASVQPGQQPSVRFVVRDDAGVAYAPNELSTLALTVGGPTTDYRWFVREDARSARAQPDGSAQYVFTGSLPSDAAGTVAVGMEAAFTVTPAAGTTPAVRDIVYNPVRYFAVTDPAPVPPRAIVKTETCNECHGTLALHGGARRNTELCVICHNATQSDIDKRSTRSGPLPPEPVLFRNLIHRIHTGEDLVKAFIIYGGSPANPQAIDLAAIEPFPKDRANCAVCHQPGTFNISPQLASQTGIKLTLGGEVVRQMGPITAACTGCHDSDQAVSHALSALAGGGNVETCATCHGTGRQFSPTAVHRIAAEEAKPKT